MYLHVLASGGAPTERVPGNHDHHRMAAAAGSIHSFFGGLTALVFGFFVFRAVGIYIATKNNGLGGLMNSLSVSGSVGECACISKREQEGGIFDVSTMLSLGTSLRLPMHAFTTLY